jgi:hypothetical protein
MTAGMQAGRSLPVLEPRTRTGTTYELSICRAAVECYYSSSRMYDLRGAYARYMQLDTDRR